MRRVLFSERRYFGQRSINYLRRIRIDPNAPATRLPIMVGESYRSKMRFIAAGPNFPDDLLEARDAGNVVFFCGAGLSSPALPGFSGLAEQVISEFGPPPGSDARAILDQLRNGAALTSPLAIKPSTCSTRNTALLPSRMSSTRS
jgi:hypothetical protein